MTGEGWPAPAEVGRVSVNSGQVLAFLVVAVAVVGLEVIGLVALARAVL